jgi:predicted membrane protein
MNLNTATRPKYKIIINGEEYWYIAICRIFGIEWEPKDLCKDDVFSTVTEKIFEISWINYMKITTKEAIIQDKINWMNLNTQTRPKYKIIINGEEYWYIAICRIFGIEWEPKDLYKDDKFHQLTEKILWSNK